MSGRLVTTTRETKETRIKMTLGLDRPGDVSVHTGLPFFDHLLSAAAFHGGFQVELQAGGDLTVDAHHLVEDTGLVMGTLIAEWAEQHGPVQRYASVFIPMDEALAHVAIDLCGRPSPVLAADYPQPRAGDFDLHLLREFWIALANRAGMALHGRVLYGENAHHMAEALFKALGIALAEACRPAKQLRSTKGVLGAD
jgi:imidazoleglycerol-phosphate dehydratase